MSYMKTFVAFNGADIMPKVNGEVMGEFQSLEYEETFGFTGEPKIKGKVKAVFFDRATLKEAIEKKPNTEFVIEYLNEYGQGAREIFINPQFTKRHVSRTIDVVVFEEEYEFEADNVRYEQFQVKPFHPDAELIFEEETGAVSAEDLCVEGGDITVSGDLVVTGGIKIMPAKEEELNREVL